MRAHTIYTRVTLGKRRRATAVDHNMFQGLTPAEDAKDERVVEWKVERRERGRACGNFFAEEHNTAGQSHIPGTRFSKPTLFLRSSSLCSSQPSPVHPTMKEDITDPADWPVEFAPLREIDSHLRCPICKDLFRAAMMLQCHHNFCSECIRRHLDKESTCPACRVSTSTSQMRRNVTLDEIANSFKDCRSV